jgi:hypothetical protein
MKSASERVAAKPLSLGAPGVRRRCDGPFVLHEDGRIACTGVCQHGKIWERVPFLAWDHLKAKKNRCAVARTAGPSCTRCVASGSLVDLRVSRKTYATAARRTLDEKQT